VGSSNASDLSHLSGCVSHLDNLEEKDDEGAGEFPLTYFQHLSK